MPKDSEAKARGNKSRGIHTSAARPDEETAVDVTYIENETGHAILCLYIKKRNSGSRFLERYYRTRVLERRASTPGLGAAPVIC